jgi:hypothetical protein
VRCHGPRHVRRKGVDPNARRARRAWAAEQYGAVRFETACSRANTYGTPGLNVVKRIFEKGLDQHNLLAAFDALARTYAEGGRFYRATYTITR